MSIHGAIGEIDLSDRQSVRISAIFSGGSQSTTNVEAERWRQRFEQERARAAGYKGWAVKLKRKLEGGTGE